jgi:hypothetical protein
MVTLSPWARGRPLKDKTTAGIRKPDLRRQPHLQYRPPVDQLPFSEGERRLDLEAAQFAQQLPEAQKCRLPAVHRTPILRRRIALTGRTPIQRRRVEIPGRREMRCLMSEAQASNGERPDINSDQPHREETL